MKCQKDLFSLKPDIHYLNCASKSPLLKSAEEACLKALIRERNPSDIASSSFFEEVDVVRELFGKIINCTASQVAIIPASSYGFASILNNVVPKKKGKAIVMKEEFPSGYLAMEKWCKTHDNTLEIVEPDQAILEGGAGWNQKILDAIDNNTSVVLLSSIHWMAGVKFDLEAIGQKCAQVGAIFIVDGSQSVGAMPIDVKKYQIDALVCAGYKWLFGSYSLSLLYMSDRFKDGIPIEESWMNRVNARKFSNLTDYELEYTPHAGRYNVGQTSNFILMPILKEGLQQLNQWTIPSIQQYCQDLAEPLIAYMDNLGDIANLGQAFAAHLFALRLPTATNWTLLQESLAQNKFFISNRGDYYRVSLNVFNTQEDIQKLIEIIDHSIPK